MTELRNVTLNETHSGFGEIVTVAPSPIWQYSFEYTVTNDELMDRTTSGSGSISQGTAMASVVTGTTSGSDSLLQTKKIATYKPGQGGRYRFTVLFTDPSGENQDQLAGIVDEVGSTTVFKNGFAIGYVNSTAFGIHRFTNDGITTVALTAADDPLDGTGASGMTVDWTKLNIIEIEFGYLGAASILFKIFDTVTNRFVTFHTVTFANANTAPHVYMPHFRGTVYADNRSTNTSFTVKTASMAYFVDGSTNLYQLHQPLFGKNAERTSVTTENNIVTIQNKTSYASKTNFIEIEILNVSASIEASAANNLGKIRLIKNASTGGSPSFSDVETTDSVCEFDTAGTTISSGLELFAIQLAGKNDAVTVDLSPWRLVLAPGENICAAGTSANSATIDVSLTWRELF